MTVDELRRAADTLGRSDRCRQTAVPAAKGGAATVPWLEISDVDVRNERPVR
jgi:hypothetical protein